MSKRKKDQITTADLMAAVQGILGEDEKNTPENYRYAIYARKSTDDPIRQSRSLSDQIDEATELSQRLGLKVVKIINESESAAEPDLRPKFRQMIEEIQGGQYEGIIAWKPDRLARNMKEGGEVIDLIDKNIIKDIKFVSFSFENNSAGKMLLGMAFVVSKQYSDQLSDNVKRGNQRSIGEGKYINTPKHGYYKDPNQYLRPDGENFLILKEAFVMRLAGDKLEDIVEYINSRGYQRPRKTPTGRMTHIPFQMTVNMLSRILRDHIYAGVMSYGKQVVDLTEEYDFKPMISVSEFLELNKFDDIASAVRSVHRNKRDGVYADLLRGVVQCGSCNENMYSGITSKKMKDASIRKYFYYRCETDGCDFQSKSVRAKVILQFAFELLEQFSLDSRATYDKYKQQMQKTMRERLKQVDHDARSLRTKVSSFKRKIQTSKDLIAEHKHDKGLVEEFSRDMKLHKKQLKETQDVLQQLEAKTAGEKSGILTYEEYLELFGNIAKVTSEIKSMPVLDKVLQSMFLNFVVKNRKVIDYKLKTPFQELVAVANSDILSDCRGSDSYLELFDIIIQNALKIQEWNDAVRGLELQTNKQLDPALVY